MAEVVVRPLARSDDRSDFGCGDIELDRFFQRHAGRNQLRHHIGNTYVTVDGERILGFVTVSPGEITGATVSEHTRKRLPDYPPPILRVSRLAIDHRAQRRGIGKLLLRFAFRLALELRDLLRMRRRRRRCQGRRDPLLYKAGLSTAGGDARHPRRPPGALANVPGTTPDQRRVGLNLNTSEADHRRAGAVLPHAPSPAPRTRLAPTL